MLLRHLNFTLQAKRASRTILKRVRRFCQENTDPNVSALPKGEALHHVYGRVTSSGDASRVARPIDVTRMRDRTHVRRAHGRGILLEQPAQTPVLSANVRCAPARELLIG